MCIPVIGKILTAQAREEINNSLKSCELFSEELKWCHKGNRGTWELLHNYLFILRERENETKNIAIAYIAKQNCTRYSPANLYNTLPLTV